MKDNPRILLPALPAPFYEIGTMLEFWALFLPINVGHLGLKVSKYQKNLNFSQVQIGDKYGTGKLPIPAKNDLKVCFLFTRG